MHKATGAFTSAAKAIRCQVSPKANAETGHLDERMVREASQSSGHPSVLTQPGERLIGVAGDPADRVDKDVFEPDFPPARQGLDGP